MPTPNEKKALAFLAAVAVLGAAVRLGRATGAPVPIAFHGASPDTAPLDHQLAAVDSARTTGKGRRKKTRGSGDGGRGSQLPIPAPRPPTPGSPNPLFSSLPRAESPQPRAVIDLDIATEAQIEALPGIGPALAHRIVADRAARGPFVVRDSLRRVRGVGAALLARLDSLVTFSGALHPLQPVAPESAVAAPRRPRRRRGSGGS